MEIYYINSKNQRIDFKNELMISNTDLFDSVWSYESEMNRIYNIQKPIKESTIELHILSDEICKHYDYMLEVFEVDVVSKKMGKLYVSSEDYEYYLNCYIMDNLNSSWMYRKDYMFKTLKVVSNDGLWKQKHLSKYFKTSSDFKTKTYPHGYPYQYQIGSSNSQLANVSYRDSHFVMTIYGPCLNPSIAIEENTYTVNTKVEENEMLIIDYSSESVRKIEKIDVGGAYSINCFNERDKSGNFFKKIKSGINSVTWDGSFAFDIVLYEERSQPKWI